MICWMASRWSRYLVIVLTTAWSLVLAITRPHAPCLISPLSSTVPRELSMMAINPNFWTMYVRPMMVSRYTLGESANLYHMLPVTDHEIRHNQCISGSSINLHCALA